jgi:hypothetical protein
MPATLVRCRDLVAALFEGARSGDRFNERHQADPQRSHSSDNNETSDRVSAGSPAGMGPTNLIPSAWVFKTMEAKMPKATATRAAGTR